LKYRGVRRHYSWRGRPGTPRSSQTPRFVYGSAAPLPMAWQAWDFSYAKGQTTSTHLSALVAPRGLARQGAAPLRLARQPRQQRLVRLGLLLDWAGKLWSLAAAPAREARQGCGASQRGAAGLQRQREWCGTSVSNARCRKPGQNVSQNFQKFTSNTWPSAHVPQS
jgi:hypothetical protein